MAIVRIPPSDLPDIFYEEPEPEEDGMQKAMPLNHIRMMLYGYYDDRPDVFVGARGYIMYNRANGNDRVEPDCFIAFYVDVERIKREKLPNFWVWEVGKCPDFALEMASPSTVADDLGPRRDLYARLGIAEYWRLDHTGGELYGQPLIGERLANGVYKPYPILTRADGAVTSFSELLGLAFYWGEERGFDILDPKPGRTVATRESRLEKRYTRFARREAWLSAEARADAADTRANAEQARAYAAEARVRALQDELERLRRLQAGQ